MSVSLDVLSLKSLSNGLANTKNMGRSGKKTCSSLGEYFYFSSWYVGINFSWDCSHLIKLIFLLKWNLGCLLIKGSSFWVFFGVFFLVVLFCFSENTQGKKKARWVCGTYKKVHLVLYNCIYPGVHTSDLLHAVRVTHSIWESSLMQKSSPEFSSQ